MVQQSSDFASNTMTSAQTTSFVGTISTNFNSTQNTYNSNGFGVSVDTLTGTETDTQSGSQISGQTLTSSQPGSMRDLAIMFMETHYAPFADLIHTIRTGQPAAEKFYGQPFFTWLSHHPEQASRFTGAMANLTSGFKTAAIAALPLDGAGTIVDVGGADGTVLAAILAAHPHMRGVLFDLPHVITSAP